MTAMESADHSAWCVTDVSEAQLIRIVRMTAAVGFLQEPRPGYLAHTSLSVHFVSDLSYLDATMLLAEIAAPCALQMSAVTRRGIEQHPEAGSSAYNLAFNTSQSFQAACEQQPRLNRKWLAYLRHAMNEDDGVIEALKGVGMLGMVNECVVNVRSALRGAP